MSRFVVLCAACLATFSLFAAESAASTRAKITSCSLLKVSQISGALGRTFKPGKAIAPRCEFTTVPYTEAVVVIYFASGGPQLLSSYQRSPKGWKKITSIKGAQAAYFPGPRTTLSQTLAVSNGKQFFLITYTQAKSALPQMVSLARAALTRIGKG